MSQQTTIRKLAELVDRPVEKLLEQLAEAGMAFDGPDQVVTSIEKMKLLGFLKRAHGKDDKAAEDIAAPKKITLNRRKVQELTVGGGKTKSTVAVEVRQKRTYFKTGEMEAPPVTDERADALRKLEESRQRNLTEQQKLAEDDKRRADEIADRKRMEEEAAAAKVAAVAVAEVEALEETPKPKPGHHGAPKPAPRTEAPRGEDRGQPKHKTRGSHAMVAGVEDDDSASRFAGQLHLSASDRARRSTARVKPKPKRQAEQARSGSGGPHGFSKPTAPIVREVAIGDAITVADLAQKLALKGGDVVKTLFKMGVMATITQTIDH
ncbi:MAG: translation initiation factor IF-2 N-terminal domain-containing protein, partial [Luteimonas sp.]